MRTVEGQCERCGENKADRVWVGETGWMGATHDYAQALWCDRCVEEESVKHMRKCAVKLPEAEVRLAMLGGPADPAVVKRVREERQRALEQAHAETLRQIHDD